MWAFALLVIAWLAKSRLSALRRPLACLQQHYSSLITLGTLLAHVGYYTLVIGGDHFEYRVYSHLILLVMLASIWLLTRVFQRAPPVYALFLLLVALSWPIPWVHWSETHRLSTRDETFMMARPIANRFPDFLRPAIRRWDEWQAWLIYHFVGMRHQEHKIFHEFQLMVFPDRKEGFEINQAELPVLRTMTVGVPAWVLPQVAILDELGLNDRIVARSPFRYGVRRMSHARKPPPGYFECFRPNVEVRSRQAIIRERPTPLHAADVKTCEYYKWY
jgi:arabinofuranosyltransferase